MMQLNLRGELTWSHATQLEECDLIDAVARSLHSSSPEELKQLGSTLFPAMINAAVLSSDKSKVNNVVFRGKLLKL